MVDHLQAHLLQGKIKLAPVSKKNKAQLLDIPCPALEPFEVEVGPPEAITEEAIQEAMYHWLRGFAKVKPRAPGDVIAEGDDLTVSMIAYGGGRVVPGTSRENVPLTPDTAWTLPGMYEALIGKKVGASEVVDVVYPDDFPAEELQGVKLVYSVDILAALEVDMGEPEEVIKQADIESPEALVEELAVALDQQYTVDWFEDVRDEILDQWVARAGIDVPKKMIDLELIRYWEQSEGAQLKKLEVPIEQQTESKDYWLAADHYREEVTATIQLQAALAAIIKEKQLDATEEEVQELLEEGVSATGGDVAEAEDADVDSKKAAAGLVLMEKAAELILEQAQVIIVHEDGTKEPVDYLALLEELADANLDEDEAPQNEDPA